jgi:hypothetical protein
MVKRTAVVNASPLIHLAEIGRLRLLNAFFDSVRIPTAVLHELRGLNIDELSFSPLDVQNRFMIRGFLGQMHLGEVEVIVGAIEFKAGYVVLDDNAGRKTASQLGLEVTGTLGILQRAAKLGLISNLEHEILKLKQSGMYLTDALVQKILSQ